MKLKPQYLPTHVIWNYLVPSPQNLRTFCLNSLLLEIALSSSHKCDNMSLLTMVRYDDYINTMMQIPLRQTVHQLAHHVINIF